MFKNRFMGIVVVWVVAIIATVGLIAVMPVISTLSSNAATDMEASANMDRQLGVVEATRSMPYWSFALAPVCAIVYTVYVLKVKRD